MRGARGSSALTCQLSEAWTRISAQVPAILNKIQDKFSSHTSEVNFRGLLQNILSYICDRENFLDISFLDIIIVFAVVVADVIDLSPLEVINCTLLLCCFSRGGGCCLFASLWMVLLLHILVGSCPLIL